MSAPLVDWGIESDDAPLCVSEYWPTASPTAPSPAPDPAAQFNTAAAVPASARNGKSSSSSSWWESTNWFRVQERREFEAQYAAQQAALGLPTTPPPVLQQQQPSYTVSHPLHDDPAAAVEYGGLGDDGSEIGERYSGKSMRGIGSGLGKGAAPNAATTAPSSLPQPPPASAPAPLTEQQRLAEAPGGAEVFCRFNTGRQPVVATPAVATSPVALAPTAVAVATAAPPPSTGTAQPVAMPSLLARAHSDSIVSSAGSSAAKAKQQPSARLRLNCIQGFSPAVKRQLHELVVLPLFHPALFARVGVRPSRGVLLTGASGVGKSQLVSSLVAELGHRVYFQHVDAAHLLTEMQKDLASRKAADPRNLESTLGVQNSGTGLGAPQELGDDILSKLFATCRKNTPSLLFIDEIDVIGSSSRGRDGGGGGGDPLLGKIRALLKINLDRLSASRDAMVVLGATNLPGGAEAALDPVLLRVGRFDRVIALQKPDERGRIEILQQVTKDMRLAGGNEDDETSSDAAAGRKALLQWVASRTQGFVASDLANLATEAGLVCIRELLQRQAEEAAAQGDDVLMRDDDLSESVTPVPLSSPLSSASTASSWDRDAFVRRRHFARALEVIRPAAGSHGVGFDVRGRDGAPVEWTEVGGAAKLKDVLLETIEAPLLHPEIYARFGMAASSGVLLYGPPGCGKTLMAQAIAARARASFLSVKGPELLSSYLGESEANIRSLFARARAASPCVLFLDEIDSIGLSRSSGSRGPGGGESTADRVLNTLLTEMDGRIMGGHANGGDDEEEGGGAEQNKKHKADGEAGADAPSASTSSVAAATTSSDDSNIMSDVRAPLTVAATSSKPVRARGPPRRSPPPIVFVVAATNRPDLLDPALLRPGRLDQLLFVGLPNEASRLDILRTLLRQTPCAPEVFADDAQVLRDMARGPCRGLSGADLASLANRARKYAITEFLARRTAQAQAQAQVQPQAGGKKAIPAVPLELGEADRLTVAHLERALAETRPSVSQDTLAKYKAFNMQLRGRKGGRVGRVGQDEGQPIANGTAEALAAAASQPSSASASATSASATSATGNAADSSSPPSELASLRASLRADIAAKLRSLGGADPQAALNAVLADLLRDTNAGTYAPRQPVVASVGNGHTAASSAPDADAPVSLAMMDEEEPSVSLGDRPAPRPKVSGREK